MKKFITAGLMMIMALGAFAQSTGTGTNPFPKTINVTGSAEMEIVPDEIYVVVDLKEYEKKGTGKIDLEKIKKDFLDNCRSVGIPDSNISIASYEGYNNGNQWWRKSKKKEELYASIAYQIKFSNSKRMDELIEKLDDDATQNFQIVRTSHSKIQEYRKQLKIQAIKAAKEKATYLAAAIDEQIGAAVTIAEPGDMTIQPYRNAAIANFSMDAAKFSSNNPIPVDFKKIKLKFEVAAVFALK